MRGAPISGMTAVGLAVAGTIRNQGRVGLCHSGVAKPLK